MTEPLVSVLIPTYRRPEWLRLALASALRQTYGNLEIIIRDNASGDQTPDVVRSFDDSRIVFLQAAENEGPTRNGQECVRRARGKYLLPLCDDDLLGENYVSILTNLLEEDPSVMAGYGATHAIDEHGEVTARRSPQGTFKWHAGETIQAWCAGTLPLISGINFLCRTSFFLSLEDRHLFPEGHNSDNAIFMAAAIRGKVLFTDQCIFYYRLHGLNTEQRLACKLLAQGDREFLIFLNDEVSSDFNVGLPVAEWQLLRVELQAMLGRIYFWRFLRFRLQKDNVLDLVRDTCIYPFAAYGVRNSVRHLYQNYRSLLREVGSRIFGEVVEGGGLKSSLLSRFRRG